VTHFQAGKVVNLSVSAVDPPWGHQGDLNKTVIIKGAGFEVGATVEWLRNGVADPHITVSAVQFVDSKTLNATIDIAVDAELSFYDVAVINTNRKQGIGTELFEVTQAIPIEGATISRGVSDGGAVVGGIGPDAFIHTDATGLVNLGPGQAWGVDAANATVVGHIANGSNLYSGVVWSVAGASFGSAVVLPMAASSEQSHAFTISPDGNLIGGSERLPATSKAKYASGSAIPMLWLRDGISWLRQPLPIPTGAANALVHEVNSNGWAVGSTGNSLNGPDAAVVWERTGATSWTAKIIGPAGGSVANSMNAAGDLIVGRANDVAVYWQRDAAGAWIGPTVLICATAYGVSDTNVIVVSGCDRGSRRTGAILTGGFTNPIYLQGLGDRTTPVTPLQISPNGGIVAGYINASTQQAVKWEF
jgi:hypothetical protein